MNPVPSLTPAPAPAEALTKLSDFPDQLPPMLVKELRQSLRTRSFSIVFISLQFFLLLLILISTTATGSSADQAGETLSRIIFLLFSLTVLVLQPLRGINSVHMEIKTGTIDLMALTGLSARRIILGKWIALIGQNVLMFVAIIPYLLLRYFFGAMDLFAELRAMSAVLVLSCMMCAIPIGLSANKAVLIRTIFPLVQAAFFAITTLVLCLSPGFGYCLRFFALEEAHALEILLLAVAVSLHLSFSFLTYATICIAPISENHSSGFRVWTLGFMIACYLVARWLNFDPNQIYSLLFVVALPVLLIGATEPQRFLPRLAQPFVRWGRAGRGVGLLLYPCRSSALLFSVLIGSLLMAVFFGNAITLPQLHRLDRDSAGFSCVLGTVFFALLLQNLIGKKSTNPLALLISILAGAVMLTIAVLSVTSAISERATLALFFWLPSIHLAQLNETQLMRDGSFFSWFMTLVYLVILLFIGVGQSLSHRATVSIAVNEHRARHAKPS